MIAVATNPVYYPHNIPNLATVSFSFCNTSLIPHFQFPQIMANTIAQSTKDRLWSIIENDYPVRKGKALTDYTWQKFLYKECLDIIRNGLQPEPIMSNYDDVEDFEFDLKAHKQTLDFHQFLCDNNFL